MNVWLLKSLTHRILINSLSEQSPLLPTLENGLHYESPTVRTAHKQLFTLSVDG